MLSLPNGGSLVLTNISQQPFVLASLPLLCEKLLEVYFIGMWGLTFAVNQQQRNLDLAMLSSPTKRGEGLAARAFGGYFRWLGHEQFEEAMKALL